MSSTHSNYQPILDTRQNRLSFELSRGDGIDSKALGVLAANIAVLIFIAQASMQLGDWQWVILLVPFVVSLVFNAAAMLWPMKYRSNVSVTDHPEYLSMDEEDLLLQLIADTEGAIEENTYINALRQGWCSWSIVLFVVGAGILGIILVK